MYLGHKVRFLEDVHTDNVTFLGGQTQVISPSLIYLLASDMLKEGDFFIVLKQLHELTTKDVLALASVAAPRPLYSKDHVRKINRHGQGDDMVVEVSLGIKKGIKQALLVNSGFDLCIQETVVMKGRDITESKVRQACRNQSMIFRWMVDHGFDVFRLNVKHENG